MFVTLAGAEVPLTPTEFDILAFLARNADLVVTQKMILEHVWGPEWVEDAQTLRVHVSHPAQEDRTVARRAALHHHRARRRLSAVGPRDRRWPLTEQDQGFPSVTLRWSKGEARVR